MGFCEDAPDKYCGHVLEPENGEADDRWHERMRNAACLREPKYDGLCVWHGDIDDKTAEELVESRLTPDDVPWKTEYVTEHFSGAISRGIEFPTGFSFGGCVLVRAGFSDADLLVARSPCSATLIRKQTGLDSAYVGLSGWSIRMNRGRA